ncbi:MAG: hypothetical protein KQI35_09540 [Bacteroidetes bacterium]|nr:hypothetical protein [Bacteroidota bacterium]
MALRNNLHQVKKALFRYTHATIYQAFDNKDHYQSIEEKAAPSRILLLKIIRLLMEETNGCIHVSVFPVKKWNFTQ